MSNSTAQSKNEISITQHLEKFESVLEKTQAPIFAILATASDIAVEIKSSLMSLENLATKNCLVPIMECNSTECYMWAIALLSAAWTQWVLKKL